MATYIEPGVVQDEKSKSFIFHQRSCIPMLTLETCGDFLFLETFFAVRITGKSKQHFNCCSIILKFNVEGKKINKLV